MLNLQLEQTLSNRFKSSYLISYPMKNKYLTPFIALTVCILLSSGRIAAQEVKGSVTKTFEKAEQHLFNEEYRAAIELYKKCDSLNPSYKHYYDYKQGVCYLYSSIDNAKALQLIKSNASNFAAENIYFEVLFHLAKAYAYNEQLDSATKYFDLSLSTKRALKDDKDDDLTAELLANIEWVKNAKQLVASSVKAKIKNIPAPVNSEYQDYRAVTVGDEDEIIFTSRRVNETSKDLATGSYNEDIYTAQRNANGNFVGTKLLSPNTSSTDNEASSALTADGKTLYMYVGDKKGSDLFTSTKDGETWSKPTSLGSAINSKFWETTICLSPDQATLYFVSDKEGGQGGRDIYTATKNSDGTWGNVSNLGSMINTDKDEETPFLSNDGKTLYFSSKGHNSTGGFDIFYSNFEDGKWSVPRNLGYPVNSTTDDFNFISLDGGKRGYFSSARSGGQGQQDIYNVIFTDKLSPKNILRTRLLADAPSMGTINFELSENGKVVSDFYRSNNEKDLLCLLEPGKIYNLKVSGKNYLQNVAIESPAEGNQVVYQEIKVNEVKLFGDVIGYETEGYWTDDKLYTSNAEISNVAKSINYDYVNLLKDKSENDGNSVSKSARFEKMLGITNPVLDQFGDVMSNKLWCCSINDKIYLPQYNDSVVAAIKASKEAEALAVNNPTTKPTDKGSKLKDKQTTTPVGTTPKETVKEDKGTTDMVRAVVYEKVIPFGFDKSDVVEQYQKDLDNALDLLKKYPNYSIEIYGHTDALGADIYNLALSKRRCDAVAKYLKQNGLSSSRIKTKGFGESQPIADNDTEEGQAKNRRAEIRITAK